MTASVPTSPYWDHGTIILDMRDPAQPVFLGKTGFGAMEEGNAHSNAVWNGGRLMVVGTFEVPTTRQFPAPDAGDYTVHDPKVRGNTMFYSWYAEGIVAVDVAGVAQGRQPRFIAQWQPPLPNPDPSGGLPDTGQVWGVALERDLVLAADQNSGLYVLKLRRGAGHE